MTKRLTRGEFLKLSAAFGTGLGFVSPKDESSRNDTEMLLGDGAPDLIVLNSRVYTVDETMPMAEAFAVKNGLFVAVGSTVDIKNLATTRTKVIDAEGMTTAPGFIDAHCHTQGIGDLFHANLDVRTIKEIQEELRKAAAKTKPGYWVTGFKYDDTKVRDGRRINRWDLDEAVPDKPVRVSHRGGHLGWYNSKALELAGINKDTEDPFGGRFERDEKGDLTGLAEETAREVFDGVAQEMQLTRADREAGIVHMSKLMTASGLTSVHQAGGDRDLLVALQDAYASDDLRFRMYFFPDGKDEIFSALKIAGIRTGFGNEWLRIGAVKFGADGSASGRTMYMKTPYVGRPNDYGILTMSQEEIYEVVDDAHRHGFQIGIHANGDATIEYVLNAYERTMKQSPREDPRHRLEHCSLINPELLKRIKASGAIPTPFWTYCHYHGNKWVEYGEEKMKWMFAHRSFLDHGISVAGASDYTPGPYEPLMAIQSMVTRKDTEGRVWGANQRVTVDEAFRIGTINGAYASFEETIKGSITVGKLADFVIFADDPHGVDPDQIKNIAVVRTVVGGKTMHEA